MPVKRLGTSLLFVLAAACSSDTPDSEVAGEAEAPEVTLACVTSADEAALAERASPLDSLTMDLGTGTAKLCYGRPSARGRVMVGGLDPFDQPWRMGANEPTTLHLSGPATVGDVALEAGSYALYAVPTDGEWTLVVNGNPDRWGVPITPEVRAADIGSFTVAPAALEEPVETLTFTFEPGPSGGDLVFRFEERTFSFPIVGR